MEKNYNIEKIEAYVANRLNAAERAAFEDEIVRDSGLESEVQRYALEREAIKIMLQEDYKSKIKGWLAGADDKITVTDTMTSTSPVTPPVDDIPEDNTPVIKLEPQREKTVEADKENTTKQEAKTVKMTGLRRVLSIAASVLVLIFAGSYFYASNQYAGSALVSGNYLLADSAGDKSGEVTTSRALSNGLQAFFAEQYDLAENELAAIEEGSDDYTAAQYYLGHIALQRNNYADAEKIFANVLNTNNLPRFVNRDKLRYNRLLAMVGYGNTGTLFQQEVADLGKNGSAPFSQKAVALKQKTDSFWYGLIN